MCVHMLELGSGCCCCLAAVLPKQVAEVYGKHLSPGFEARAMNYYLIL